MNFDFLRRWLYEPRVRDVDADDSALLALHASILWEKPLLRSAFETFYKNMSGLCDIHLTDSGIEVELGTGAGFFKSLRPRLVTSDIRIGPNIDIELDAQSMSLDDNSVRCIYAINVFHHLPHPERFLNELARVLKVGGGCILIEPHNGFFSAFLHRRLHDNEHFDPAASGWHTADIEGPLSGANQAMAHIVFERDQQEFERIYGTELEVIHRKYVPNALRYLLSGGLNFRQLAPSFMRWPLMVIEKLTLPIARHFSLHQITVLRKRA